MGLPHSSHRMAEPTREGRPARLSEDVAQQLARRIEKGELKPGDRLPPERHLVELFGASRTVIREALRAMAARGLIESYVGRGTYVRTPSTQDLTDKLKFLLAGTSHPEDVRHARVLIEAELAACAAQHRTPETLDVLQQAVTSGRRSERYYNALALAGQCPVIAPILSALYGLEPDPHVFDEAPALRRLLAAVRKGDPDAARAAVRSRGRKLTGDEAC